MDDLRPLRRHAGDDRLSLAVELKGITKRFGAVTALDSVNLQVEQGTIHAVVGENGAGKTTLMRILYGALLPDEGEVSVDGTVRHFRRSAEAIDAGVGMVSQHYGIIPQLTCLQNLILGAEGAPVVNLHAAEKRAQELASRMGFQFDWNREAAELSPAGAQKLEILKLLWRNARIMILDEPTAMLSPADSDALFESMKQLVAEGATVLLVTHRIPEVLQHCAQVTVLRGGKWIDSLPVAKTDCPQLAKLIVGGDVIAPTERSAPNLGSSLIEATDLKVIGDRGDEALKGISFCVREGEVVGIAGVDGSGQRELFQALVGVRKVQSGSLSLPSGSAERIRAGLRIIPEDRHDEGVIEDWSLEENAALGLQRLSPLSRGGKVDIGARRSWAEKVAARFRTKHGGLNLPMASLSGGNQQRYVAARALEFDPKTILAFQPARGLDLNATTEVYNAIRQKTEEGAGALVVSFDLDELLEHCDRILVMNGGRMFEPKPEEKKDRDAIGRLMVGAV